MEAESSRNKKRTKAGVLVSEITLEDLQSAFHLPTERACVKLGVGLTILKRLCRKHGIARWPYRALLKAGKAQRLPNTPSATSSPLSSPRVLAPAPCPTPSRDGPKACRQPSVSSSSASQCGTSSGDSSLNRRSTSAAQQPQLQPLLPASRSCAALTAALEASQLQAAAVAAPAPPPAGVAPIKISAAAAAAEQQPQAQMAKSSSQLGLLLSAIDACEGQEVQPAPAAAPGASPHTPLDAAQPWAPFTPLAPAPAGTAAAAGSSGAGPQRRPFTHSARSAFRPVAAAAAVAVAAPVPAPAAAPAAAEPTGAAPVVLPRDAALEAKRAELARRLAMLQAVQAQVCALAPSPPLPDEAAGLLRSLGTEGLEERRRLQLAEKPLMVRAALQARIARKRTALAAAAGARFCPYAAALPTPQPEASSPVPITSLPPSGSALLGGLPSADFSALASAKTLLAQYRL
ncbi:hypothetical protein ABPG75_008344 [Micractinium tetrahymenae]